MLITGSHGERGEGPENREGPGGHAAARVGVCRAVRSGDVRARTGDVQSFPGV